VVAALFGAGGAANVTGFSFSSVSGSINVAASPGPGLVSGGAFSGGVSPSTGGGFTGIDPTRYFALRRSRFGGGGEPGATVTA
jgi:hypothetical protein